MKEWVIEKREEGPLMSFESRSCNPANGDSAVVYDRYMTAITFTDPNTVSILHSYRHQ